jgi:tripartite motif-containing protein 71
LRLLPFTLLLFAVVGVSTALGSGDDPSASWIYPEAALVEGLDHNDPQAVDLGRTDPEAAKDLPRDDLNRDEAAQLLSSVFSTAGQAAVDALPDLDGAKFLSATVAVLPADNPQAAQAGKSSTSGPDEQQRGNEEPSEPALIESTLPLRAPDSDGQLAPVDLSLEPVDGGLEPANPLVEVNIPAELGDGISLPQQQIQIQVKGAPDGRSPSTVGEGTAFFPNVAADTDFTVTPTATGFETNTQLRTVEAPTVQELQLQLPEGASLEATEAGGAEVKRHGELILSIHPPVAQDANGAEVPVRLEVKGNALLTHVSPDFSTLYPVLVDPVFETYDWQKYSETAKLPSGFVPAMPDWYAASNTEAYVTEEHTRGESAGHRGMVISSGWPYGTVVPGSQANWNYYVPRFFSDYAATGIRPTTYINSVTLQGLNFRLPLMNGALPDRRHSPYFIGGIWDSVNGGWVSWTSRTGVEGQVVEYNPPPFENPNQNRGAKNFGIALASAEAGANPERHLWAEKATIELVDPEAPELTEVTDPTQWVNDKPSVALSFSAKDQGIGVSKLTLQQPTVTGSSVIMETQQGCTGGASKPCPTLWTSASSGMPQIKYNPELMPQGENIVKIAAYDAVGHRSNEGTAYPDAEPFIKVDHTKPRLSMTGTATEQETLGLTRPQYTVRYSATDGGQVPILSSEEPPSALSAFGSLGSTDGKFNHPAGIAVLDDGSTWVVDTANNRLQKFDSKGNYVVKFGTTGTGNGQLSRPTAVAVDVNGNIWVADSNNRRIQKFNASGQYLAQFGAPGTSNGQFTGSGPEGIAIDRKGNIWVADTYGGRLQVFSPNGEFLRVVGNSGSGPKQLREPTGIDFGPSGNAWVTDWANNKVVVFSEAGTFVREFGSYGSADGQFTHPDAISVDSKGQVWVADQAGHVQAFTQEGTFITKFGSPGAGPRQFNLSYPVGLVSNNRGALWIADTQNNRVQRWKVPNYAPEYASAFGSLGSENGQLKNPGGISADAAGNLWVLDNSNNRIQKFNPQGGYLLQFGSSGSGAGQLFYPSSITADSNGNIWVVDAGRIQKFSKTGQFLLQHSFGEYAAPDSAAADASGNVYVTTWWGVQKLNQSGEYVATFSSCPVGEGSNVDVAPNGNIWVVCDSSIVMVLSPTGELLQKLELQAKGEDQLVGPSGISIDSKGMVWIVNSGSGRVKEYNQAGEYVTQFGTAGTGAGQLGLTAASGITVDGKGNVWVVDTTNQRVQKWTTPTANESGVATGSIEVDEKVVSTTSPGCATQNCALSREWTIPSEQYSPGTHVARIKVTDGVGLAAEKQLTFAIARDTTKPALSVTGPLADAPEGWVQQKSYSATAVATDAGGYGVRQIQLKVDGQVAYQTVATTCPSGGCQKTKVFTVDTTKYEGGSHEVEVVATDGAGNVESDKWTMNVDPAGTVSADEAEDTLEALESTSPVNAVGPATNESEYEGTVFGLEMRPTETGFVATGSSLAPTSVSSNPEEGMTIDVTTPAAYEPSCVGEAIVEPGGELTGEEEEELAAEQAACTPAPGSGEPALESVDIEPTAVGPTVGDASISDEDTAAVAPNALPHVDQIVRPLYDGAMTFQAIRDASGSETFSWSVNLAGNQELKVIDPKHVQVFFSDGRAAFGISATPAHDAIGTAIPTTLTVSSGNIVTLNVPHRTGGANGRPYVYPVIAGAGWEGGLQTHRVAMPPPEPLPEEEEVAEEYDELSTEEGHIITKSFGPPQFLVSGDLPSRAYVFNSCRFRLVGPPEPQGPGSNLPGIQKREDIARISSQCHNPADPQPGDEVIKWATAIYGRFWFNWGQKVEIRTAPKCNKWGPLKPALVHCFADTMVAHGTDKINVLGEFRFLKGWYGVGIAPHFAGCFELNGVIPSRPQPQENGERIYHDNYHEYKQGVWEEDHCPWGSLSEEEAR